jgi:hypothetical protein
MLAKNAGALSTLSGQIADSNLADPTLFFLNGLTLAVPFANLSILLVLSSPFDVTAQMLVADPSNPDGVALTQASELHVTQGSVSIPGPTLDDSGVTVLFSNPAFCAASPTFTFFGQSYTKMDVISNGRITFGSSSLNTSFTPSVAAAMTDFPFMGPWCDLNPATGGSITISNPYPGILRVDWGAVPYFATTIPNTFGIEIDGVNGTFQFDGLSTVGTTAANQFVGISPGNLGPAVNAGATTFVVGGPFQAASPTAMTYAFGPAGSLTPGLTTLQFLPNASNYNWVAY